MSVQEAIIELLCLVAPELRAMLAKHLEEFGELLPTMFLADVARWVVAELSDRSEEAGSRGQLIMALDLIVCIGSETTKDIIVTGFVEALPEGAFRGDSVLANLGPTLTAYRDIS